MRRTQLAMDLLTLLAAFWLAYVLRFDFAIPGPIAEQALRQTPYVVAIQFAALAAAGVYNFVWRFVGMSEIRAFLNAALWSFLPIITLRLGIPDQYHHWRVPISIVLIDSVLAFGGVVGLRVMRRALYERFERQVNAERVTATERKPVLLIGAGSAGVLAAHEIRDRGKTDLDIVGFVDDDPALEGSVIHGIEVLGSTADLPEIVRRYRVDHVVITMAAASGQQIRRIVKICDEIPIKVRTVPSLYEILQGQVNISRIRDLQVEDLLSREPIQLDEEAMRDYLAGKRVMVTGAGGSIGSELARQVCRFSPAKLMLVERAEFALFSIDRELRERWPFMDIVPVVADVGDRTRVRSVFAKERPEVVLHAAAHKHVPMMEYNPSEAVKNNLLATYTLGEIAGEYGTESFVLISTDKAVRPSSVMGASKRAAELVVQDFNRRYETRFLAVRFGNVIGSAGSVIPIFRDQIRRGGPITVTHPDMVRYFMTIPEAAQLVLQAGSMGGGGEIFTLDMGQPVRILDLAKDTIKLSGLTPYEDIDIVVTGVRPGEKLIEELDTADESLAPTLHPKIFVARIASLSRDVLRRAVDQLVVFSRECRDAEIRAVLCELVPDAQFDGHHPVLNSSPGHIRHAGLRAHS
jgi:FlaA1/EpsC-like NDP-sugar epimerase